MDRIHQTRRELIFDMSVCLGFPVVMMALCELLAHCSPFLSLSTPCISSDYFVQAAPYTIYEDLGCSSAVLEWGLSLILIHMWTVIPSTISVLFYCRESSCFTLFTGRFEAQRTPHSRNSRIFLPSA